MESLPCQGCRGLCCGPVPVTEKELAKLKKKIRSMPAKKRLELKNQQRYHGTCIFYDLHSDKCGVHSARPSVCKAFGYHQNLICFRNPKAALDVPWLLSEKAAGILSVDFTWKNFA